MSLSTEKEMQISIAIGAINIQINRMKKGLKEITPRIEKLHRDGFHIEAVIVNGQLVEHALKLTLRVFQFKRMIANILNLPDPYKGKPSTEGFEKKEMGKLIDIFKKIEGTSDLTKELDNFKDLYRNDYVHHIFDGSHDLKEEDQKAKQYLSSFDFAGMVLGIVSVHLRVQQEVNQLLARHA